MDYKWHGRKQTINKDQNHQLLVSPPDFRIHLCSGDIVLQVEPRQGGFSVEEELFWGHPSAGDTHQEATSVP